MLVLTFVLSMASAFASPAMELVPKASGHKTMSTTVSTGGAAISTADFVSAILDGSRYPKTASYMGVKALLDCTTLEKRSDGYTVVYQRTGGNSLVKSRHYVIALRVTQQTESQARIEWNLVKHDFDGSSFSGPYASALNGHLDAVYTPYNYGWWSYDKSSGSITYAVQSDAGGSIPSWMVSESAVMAFPLELLKTRWGIGG